MSQYPQFLALVRHGQSEANVATQAGTDGHYYPVNGSDHAISLTAQGHLDSGNAGIRLSRLFPTTSPIARMYINRFQRVQQSADEIEKALGYKLPRIEDGRLEKRSYGDFWNLSYKGVEELHPEEFALFQQQGKLLYRPPGGENYPDVYGRVQQFVDEVVNPSSENILVVTHAVVILSVRKLFEGISDQEVLDQYESMALPNGHIQLYSRSGPGAPWTPVAVPL